MNKKSFYVFIVIIFFLIFVGCSKDKEVQAPETVDSFYFKVQFALGDVTITGASGEKKAAQGDQLKNSDTIVTGKKSVADLVFGTSGVIRIKENSRIKINGIADKTGTDTVIDMENGKVFLTLSKLKGTGFKVKTPTVVASVRGTSFRVVSDIKGSKLSVVKGTVALNPVKNGNVIEDKTVDVNTGHRTDYIDKKAVERIIMGKMEIPVMEMTPAEKIEVHGEVKDIRLDDMPDLSLEIKDKIKLEIAGESAEEIKTVEKKDNKDAEMKLLAEKAKKKEEDSKNIAEANRKKEEEMKRQEELLKAQAEEKKKKEEQIKKERASNIPTM